MEAVIPMACGLTMDEAKISELRQFLNKKNKNQFEDNKTIYYVDLVVSISGAIPD